MTMKKIFFTILAISIFSAAYAQIDRSKMPEPGPAPQIKIGEARSFTLDNGLRVFVVENSKVPRVTYSLVFDYDPVFDKEMAGLTDITGGILRTATANRTKEMIDEEIDFIGASMSVYAGGLYASGLSKYTSTLAELIADVIINARFEEEHFNRVKTQTLSGLMAGKNEPSSVAARVNNVLLYGSNHPYGLNITEKSLENITLENCERFYNTYYKPEITYMAVVGDVKFDEIKKIVENYFGKWERGLVPKHSYPTPMPPKGVRVAVVDRPNAVQSVIRVGYPVDLKPGAEDIISARVMNSILGGGTSRLFNNLRETHGFTYGAYSSLSSGKLVGSFVANTDVRTIATDSAVNEILYEIRRMQNELVPLNELNLFKNEMNGNFALSLEDPQTIANFALNIARYDLPADYYTTYLQRLAAINENDILKAANKYLMPNNVNILVVGNASEIAEGLKRFSSTGKILYFDEDGNEYDPAKKLKAAPEGMNADEVIGAYINAIGGEKNLKGIKDVSISAISEIQGMSLNIDTYLKAPDKYRMEMGSGGTIFSKQIFDGTKGIFTSPMGEQPIEGELLEDLKFQSVMNIELYYDKYNIKRELKGIETVGEKEAYKVEITYPTSRTETQYFDVETGLRIKLISENGVTEIADYREVSKVKFPFSIKQTSGPQSFDMKVLSVKVNSKLKDDLFKVN